jgi:hypothetical protein
MDDFQKRADDQAWDKKQDRWISDANRQIEGGLNGEALAALHGLHISSDDQLPYDFDETSETDDQETLRRKIIIRLVQIGDTISSNRDVPDDVRQKWTGILQRCYPGDANSLTLLRNLRRDVDGWKEIDPQAEVSLLSSAINAVATMIDVYLRRFCAR